MAEEIVINLPLKEEEKKRLAFNKNTVFIKKY